MNFEHADRLGKGAGQCLWIHNHRFAICKNALTRTCAILAVL